MSYFGDGTFKEDVLGEIRWRIGHYKMTNKQTVAELLEVVAYFARLEDGDE